MGTIDRRLVRATLATVGVIGALLATAPAASAAPAAARDGRCDANEFCLYHDYDLGGSVADFTTSIPDYGRTQPNCYEYRGGPSNGQCVKNNALSGYNRTNRVVRLYFNSGYGGTFITFQPGEARDGGLGPLDRQNASHEFR